MTFEEKLAEKRKNNQPIILELGCGNTKMPGALGIDKFPGEQVDFVADIELGLPFLPDNSVDEIHSRHFLEHIERLDLLIMEIHRVLKPGGLHHAIVPHFSNPHFYSDYTHRRFFGLYTFDYFADRESQLKRKVPPFYNDIAFHITRRYLRFYSLRPWLNLSRRMIGLWVNRNSSAQERYEESWCYSFPCQEIHFEMRKNIH